MRTSSAGTALPPSGSAGPALASRRSRSRERREQVALDDVGIAARCLGSSEQHVEGADVGAGRRARRTLRPRRASSRSPRTGRRRPDRASGAGAGRSRRAAGRTCRGTDAARARGACAGAAGARARTTRDRDRPHPRRRTRRRSSPASPSVPTLAARPDGSASDYMTRREAAARRSLRLLEHAAARRAGGDPHVVLLLAHRLLAAHRARRRRAGGAARRASTAAGRSAAVTGHLSSQPPEHADHLAEHLDLLGIEGAERLVRGVEPYAAAVVAEPLDGGLLAVDQRRHDLAVGALGLCRRITTKSPSRMPASIIDSPRTRSRKLSPDAVSISGTAISSSTCCSASVGAPAAIRPSRGSMRMPGRSAMTGAGSTGAVAADDAERAGLRRIAAKMTEALEVREVRVHGRGRREADGLADLAHRRRVAMTNEVGVDHLEDLLLPRGQVGHVVSRRGSIASNTCSDGSAVAGRRSSRNPRSIRRLGYSATSTRWWRNW